MVDFCLAAGPLLYGACKVLTASTNDTYEAYSKPKHCKDEWCQKEIPKGEVKSFEEKGGYYYRAPHNERAFYVPPKVAKK